MKIVTRDEFLLAINFTISMKIDVFFANNLNLKIPKKVKKVVEISMKPKFSNYSRRKSKFYFMILMKNKFS